MAGGKKRGPRKTRASKVDSSSWAIKREKAFEGRREGSTDERPKQQIENGRLAEPQHSMGRKIEPKGRKNEDS